MQASMKRAYCGLTLLCLIPLLAEADEPVIKVNPVGVPKNIREDSLRYFLWYNAAGWHLRTDTGGKPHVFTGTIHVVGGKVTSISNFENLEPGRGKKKKGGGDLGILSRNKDEITFKFTTSKRRDGFDFEVDEDAKEIRVKLMIDGKVRPALISIGQSAQPAPSEAFSLPAHPARDN